MYIIFIGKIKYQCELKKGYIFRELQVAGQPIRGVQEGDDLGGEGVRRKLVRNS